MQFLIVLTILFIFIPEVYAFANGTFVWGDTRNPGLLNATNYTFQSTIGLPAYGSNLATVSQTINWTKIVASTQRKEKVAAHLKGDGSLHILNCSNGCGENDWTYIGNLTIAASDSTKRGFDLVSLSSGDIMAVFANGTKTDKVYYCIWNGSVWYPGTNCGPNFLPNGGNEINVSRVGIPYWLEMAERNNKILLGVAGSTGFAVSVWDGTKWNSNYTITASALGSTAQPSFGIAWENGTGDGLVLYDLSGGTAGVINYRKFNGTTSTWSTSDQVGPDTGGGNNHWIDMSSDPVSNRIAIGVADSETDAHLYIWKTNNL